MATTLEEQRRDLESPRTRRTMPRKGASRGPEPGRPGGPST